MIEPVEMYTAKCDKCGEPWESDGEGWTAVGEVDRLRTYLTEQGWHIGDGNEGELNKTYCPNCWHYDDQEVFTIGPKSTQNELPAH